MPNSRRPKAVGRRETLANTSIAASGSRDVERAEVMNERAVMVDQTDSEMYIADFADGECESAMRTFSNLHMPRGGTHPENGLVGIAPFIERNPRDYVSSTLEWRGKVLQSQQATLVATRRFRQQQTAKERQNESLENKIREIREDFRKKEERLEREIVKLKQRHEENMKQLEEEENGEGYFVSESWEVQSDYQPTECGD